MKIKVLFSDLDGTLVEHAGDVNNETVDAARKLIDNGVDIVLVSGRHPDMMKSIHYNLGLKTPVIGCNGGIIKDLSTSEILYANELPAEIVKKSISIARELQIDWVVYEQNNIFFEKMPPESYKLPYKNSELAKHLQANFINVASESELYKKEHLFLKVLLIFDNKPHIMNDAKELLSKMHNIDVFHSAKTYLDVMPKGSSKGKTVDLYLNLFNIKKENIAAIGDAQNDLDMLELAQMAIAMGNGIDDVKRTARHIVGDCPEGFKEAVDYLIDSQNLAML